MGPNDLPTREVEPVKQSRRRAVDTLFKPTERFFLNPDSPVPLYYQMEQIILDRIAKENAVGRMLPREMDLIRIFGVSRATVKKTTDSLAAKGLIQRRRSVGTQIVRLGIIEDLGKLTSYTEQMASRGLSVSTEMLGVGVHLPGKRARDRLELDGTTETVFVRRLRGTSEVFPVVLLQSDIPTIFGITTEEDFHGSLYQLIEQRHRIPIEWAEEEISAAKASEDEARHLRIHAGDPVLVMERTTYTRGRKPLEFVRAVYRPEHYTFSVRLSRRPESG